MARVTYLGVTRPAEAFERYRQARREWTDLRLRCRPMSDDYVRLDDLVKALDAAASHFTGQDDFYGARAKPHSSW